VSENLSHEVVCLPLYPGVAAGRRRAHRFGSENLPFRLIERSSQQTPQETGETSMKIGLVGCGYWGKNIARNLHQMGLLGAVCDPSQKILDSVPKLYPGAFATKSLADLLKLEGHRRHRHRLTRGRSTPPSPKPR
jgi:hypothetical protein